MRIPTIVLILLVEAGAAAILPGAAAAQVADAATRVATTAQSTDAARWADSARVAIDAAYIAGDADGLVAARALVERALTRWPDDALLLHYQGFALYRESTLRAAVTGEGDDDALLERAQTSFERSAEIRAIPETQALLASVIGRRIGSNPLRGMTMGPRADRWMERAIEAGPDNPRVWLLRGIGAIFKPKLFGGGLDKAEVDLRKAIELFESDAPAPPAPAWGRGEAWIWLGQVLQRQDRTDEAREAYRKALELEPGNAWVTHVLLPALTRGG